jgi:protein phosphatase
MNLSQSLQSASLTDPGRVRDHNEDCIESRPEIGLYVLADGMGGYNAGEVASGMATSLIADGVQEEWNLREVDKLQREEAKKLAETTLLYRLRGETMEQVTRDHSLLQEQLDSGLITPEEAKLSQNKNLVTRALGIDPTVDAEIHVHEVKPDDIFVLCSDGLSDMVEDEEIRLTMLTLKTNPNLTVQQLVQAANDNGGRDNISAMLIRVTGPYGVARGFIARLKALFR